MDPFFAATDTTQHNTQASVTAGTMFQDTRSPLRLWFRAMWWVSTQKNGVSALGLKWVLGLRSYEQAWTWLHKLRRAMVRPGRDRLAGTVEVDETYLGGLEEGLGGRQVETKALIVVVAAQEDGQGIGRIRLRKIADASAASLIPFIEEAVEPGSLIHTDGWLGYKPLEKKGYRHTITGPSRSGEVSVRIDAPCSSRCVAAKALDTGNPPGGGQPQASRLLS